MNGQTPIGKIIAGYRIQREIGRGTSAIVYLAQDTKLEREVALKVAMFSPDRADRSLEREARALARLDHPGLVTIYGTGSWEGQAWIALEYLDGETLRHVLDTRMSFGRPVELRTLLSWIEQLSRAAHAAHEKGVFHGDIKPDNVVITRNGRVVLVDFSIARTEGEEHSQVAAGTLHYASPEQVRGETIDTGCDVWSIGTILYEVVTARRPFEAATVQAVMHRIQARSPIPPRRLRRRIARDLEVLILACLEKDPRRRPSSTAALADDLENVRALRPIQIAPPSVARLCITWIRRERAKTLAITILLIVAVASTFVLSQRSSGPRREAALEVSRCEEARLTGDFASALSFIDRAIALTPADPTLLARRDALERESRTKLAHDALARARAALDRARSLATQRRSIIRESVAFEQEMTQRFLTDEERVRFSRVVKERESLDVGVESTNEETLAALLAARSIDPSLHGLDQAMADYYEMQLEDSIAADRPILASLYRRKRDAFDESPPVGRLKITTNPVGLEVHAFRFTVERDVRPDGEMRIVAVPRSGRMPKVRGALEIDHAISPLEQGDLIVAIEGHPVIDVVLVADRPQWRATFVDERPMHDMFDLGFAHDDSKITLVGPMGEREDIPVKAVWSGEVHLVEPAAIAQRGNVVAEVVRHGVRHTLNIPPGVRCHATALPLLCDESSRLGTTPLELDLQEGSWVFVFEEAPSDKACIPCVIDADHERRLDFTFPNRRPDLEGFVFIGGGETVLGGDPLAFDGVWPAKSMTMDSFWILRREVTNEEYARFLNDPKVLSKIKQERGAVLVPRNSMVGQSSPLWVQGDDGSWQPPEGWARFPVFGVSWDDARKYSHWLEEHSTSGLAFDLPTIDQWEKAARGADSRPYAFGPIFVPRWTTMRSEPFGRGDLSVFSSPRDVSPYGVFDLTAGVQEWCRDVYGDDSSIRTMKGGMWNEALASFMRPASIFRLDARQTRTTLGFRVIAYEEN